MKIKINWRRFWREYENWVDECDPTWYYSLEKMKVIFQRQNPGLDVDIRGVRYDFHYWWLEEKKRLNGKIRWRKNVGYDGIPTWPEQKRKLESLISNYHSRYRLK